MKKIILAALVIYSAPVFAEDKTDWSGFYGAVLAGRTWGSVSEGDSSISEKSGYTAITSRGIGASVYGWAGSLKLGYNKQLDANLLGIELGGTWQRAKSNTESPETYQLDFTSSTPFPDGAAKLLTAQTEVNSYQTLSLRFGRIVNNALMIYVSGGAALGQIKRTIYDRGDWFRATSVISDSQTKLGYVLGFGAEYKLNDKWSIRGNYEYVDFGSVKTSYSGVAADSPTNYATFRQYNPVRMSNMSLGLSYAF